MENGLERKMGNNMETGIVWTWRTSRFPKTRECICGPIHYYETRYRDPYCNAFTEIQCHESF